MRLVLPLSRAVMRAECRDRVEERRGAHKAAMHAISANRRRQAAYPVMLRSGQYPSAALPPVHEPCLSREREIMRVRSSSGVAVVCTRTPGRGGDGGVPGIVGRGRWQR